jgi:hypothetical protein
MNRCPITYLPCADHYSVEGLQLLSPKLRNLKDFPYGESKQLQLAIDYADKLSFSGVQPKLNAKINVETKRFVGLFWKAKAVLIRILYRGGFGSIPKFFAEVAGND